MSKPENGKTPSTNSFEPAPPPKTEPAPPERPAPPTAQAGKNIVEKFYDKLPFTYRQVDIFVKIMVGILVLTLAAVIIASI